ncbi:MAG: enoyl-CoA hydratase [Rhodospirillales bacterium 69-11]|nr:crotonase/enoyl-CoA hydratase family protein [Rhodospirillales bacterium]OJW26609.1 MAG: enoyl-CoA hydratase [Rhodospirillales bacterium 69-11]
MDFQQITYAVQGTTAVITLNRPEKRNALSAQLLRELNAALLEADEHNPVHCVVLRGAGPHFCAGADLNEYSSGRGPEYRGRQEIDDDIWRLEYGQRLRIQLFDMHKPVIAQVHGTCIGIGTELAWFCDMVIAADDARIGFPPVRDLGTPPGSMWLYHCGPQWAKRLLLTGDSLSGADAAKIGLALKSYPAGELEAEVMRLADRMGLVDPHLLSANKRLVNLGLELMGARTLQRIGAEIDARGHIAPMAREFRATMKEHGVKHAFQKRDAAFGAGTVRVEGRDPD